MERESMREGADPFDACTLAELRQRRSEKWATYPPDVLPAFVAEMDVMLADPIHRTLIAAVARGDTGYAHPAGLAEAFADFARAWFAWAVDPARVVLVPDVMVGAAEVLRLTTPPGSGIVINTPAYPPFAPTIREYGRRVVDVPLLRTTHGWELDLAGLERAFRAGARGYLLCNPHNPTGRVFSRAELERIRGEQHVPRTTAGIVRSMARSPPWSAYWSDVARPARERRTGMVGPQLAGPWSPPAARPAVRGGWRGILHEGRVGPATGAAGDAMWKAIGRAVADPLRAPAVLRTTPRVWPAIPTQLGTVVA